MAYFELVNLSSGNLIGEFDTEWDALRDVITVVERRGPAALAGIALGEGDGSGRSRIIAEGGDLVRRARLHALPGPLTRRSVGLLCAGRSHAAGATSLSAALA